MNKKNMIKDICDIYDGPHATPKRTNDGPVYLGIKAISEDGTLLPHEFTFLSETDYKKWTKRITPIENDIVFSYEATLDRYVIIPKGFYGCLGRRLAIIRVKSDKVNIKWLYYYFKSPEWKTFIANHIISGSTVNRISINDFPFYPISLPKRAIQDNIVMILENIDHKIRLNNAINAELEKVAKTLYNYWFVQFDFPNAKGKPYRTSGGKMEYNEVLKREIPKGWKVDKLKNVTEIALGGTPDTQNKKYWGDQFHWLNSGEVANFPVITSELKVTQQGIDNSATKLLPYGTTILSITGNIRVSILGIQACANQSVVGVYENKILKCSYFYPLLCNMLQTYVAVSTGNCQTHINKGTIEDTTIVIPPEAIMKKYNSFCSSIYRKIINTALESRQITELRDFLLPLLMNEQVRVKKESTHREKPTIGKRLTKQQVFTRLVLAAYILDTICDEPTAGRVKFEKLLFLCLYCAQIAIKTKFRRQTFGPYDSKALFSIEEQLKDNKWFKKNAEKNQYRAYTRLGKSGNYKQYVETNFNPSQKIVIDKILRLFRTLNTERCEIVATLYGAWNDFLIDGIQPTDEQIVDEVLTNWHDKKKRIDRQRWLKALEWMREKDIIPVGFGTSTKN